MSARRRLAAAALGMALAWPAAASAKLVVVSEVLLLRHGVRSPTHEPALPPAIAPDAWPAWPVAPGELTPHGAAAIKLLGAFDRQELARDGLLADAGCPAGVTIYADVDERTVATGQAFAAGFAPGCALPVAHAAGATDPLFSPLDQPDPSFDSETAKAGMLAAAGGDVAGVVQAHLALFQQMQAALQPGGQAFLALPSKISAKAPGKLPKLSGPVAEGASAAEDFLLEYLDGKPLSDVGWGRVDAGGVSALLALHPLAYTITARPPYIAAHTAGPLAARIVAGLTDGSKLVVLVGHDTNLADLAGLLDLHWSVASYPADDPAPGGGLLFVLTKDDATGRRYVSVSYMAQTMDQIRSLQPLSLAHPPASAPLPIAGCGSSPSARACPLALFIRLIAAERAR